MALCFTSASAQELMLYAKKEVRSLPKGVNFKYLSSDEKQGNFATFLVHCENLIDLKCEKNKLDGGWEVSSMNDREDENNSAILFTLVNKKEQSLSRALADLKGVVVVVLGVDKKEKTVTLKKDGPEVDLGPFTLSTKTTEKENWKNGLVIKGDHRNITKIVLKQDGKVLETNSSSWSNDTKTIRYKKLTKEAEVTVTFYNKVKVTTVQLPNK